MEDLKVCTKCKQLKPYKLFPYRENQRRYDTWCRPCYAEKARRYRRTKPELIRSRKHSYERARRLERQLWVIDYLKSHPCVDCGESDPVVLDFDHVRGQKTESVTRMLMAGYSTKTLLKEIEKCEVRCANCHRRKTARTQGWRRAAV